ncbi:glycosyltransferase [Metabacillus indicus]|uniref:Glycosyl transferase family 1 n=1 Tax=Metabacillus indicus TaxID=246786 RepID=A0A084H4H0_METID|nr:glycosyltransferase [Metabacillus indicus]KEZ50326.1 glycosyl transferase family 1 [Metabacillus indicus LMG 22858]KEZ54482.1 glycosyl transferase family 1 [Metabacillus indicus]
MKKILFVMNNLSSGGAEKSLSSLLSSIDYSKFEVDLLLFRDDGIYFQNLPEKIKILQAPENYKYFDMSFKTAVVNNIKRGRLNLIVARIKASVIFKLEKNRARCEQRAWKYIGPTFNALENEYDVAIGYLEKTSIYYVVDYVNAKKKIGWIHTHYTNSGMDPKFDKLYFDKLDKLIAVSKECANSLRNTFNDFQDKVQVIHNIVSPNTIRFLSNIEATHKNKLLTGTNKIVTVGRLAHEKGIDLAIESCSILVETGYEINWKIIGYGTDEELLKFNKIIEQRNLIGKFELIGVKTNPYPFIKNSDIYVQPSRYEGKSIAIEEAKILAKPIVITNFSSASDHIDHKENGLIAEMSPKSLAQAIKLIIDNAELKNKLMNNLSKNNFGTESEIEKFYNLCLEN